MGTGKLRIDGAGEIQFGENPSNPPAPDFGYVSLYSQNGVLKAQNSAGQITIFGSSGTAGSSGVSGSSGSSGVSGSSGSSGVSGSSGTSGNQGSTGAAGSSGSSGTSGNQGSTGAAGSSGTSGVNGTAGTSGISFIWRGEWDPGQAYFVNDAVEYNGSSFICILTHPFDPTPPPADPTNWNYLAIAGTPGSSGSSGSSGTSGSVGPAGSSGTSGVNGSSGSSGTSSTSGTSGSSGISGTNGTSGTSGTSGANGISSGQVYYFNQSQSSDVSPYKVLSPFPSGSAQQIVTQSGIGASTTRLVQEFLTPELGFAVIPAGTQRFHAHFLKDANANDMEAWFTIELADSSGTGYGTVIQSGISLIDWIDNATPVEVTTDITLPTTTILTTDRMIVKIYVRNIGSGSHSIDWYTEGTQYYSFVVTTVGVQYATSGTSGSSGQNGSSGSSGVNGTSGSSGSSGTSGTSQAGLNFTAVFSGGGAVITPGIITYIRAPRTCTITKVTLLADQVGSAVLDIYKDDYANFPPTALDSICGILPPTLSSADKYEDSTLTGWTTSITAGQVLGFTLNSCSTITQITLQLETA